MFSSSYASELAILSFHHVEEICDNCNTEEFEQGKLVFPEYKLHWLSDDFLIKKIPEEKFSSSDIKSIKVKQITIAEQRNNFLISFKLSCSAVKRFALFSQNNIGKKAAIRINKKTLNIINILSVLEGNEFTFVVRNVELEKLLETLHYLSGEVMTIDINGRI